MTSTMSGLCVDNQLPVLSGKTTGRCANGANAASASAGVIKRYWFEKSSPLDTDDIRLNAGLTAAWFNSIRSLK
ncbi:unknown [Bacteroides sp. CAG:144]|nr:unknown [Bacteroides sp. CAG:144]